ncbi:hypothetical protein ON010_g8457 [Phytophthora cinnamomi]|nr:hypothetical protein ON010_g8457 [Phytophthora cinnamomi]
MRHNQRFTHNCNEIDIGSRQVAAVEPTEEHDARERVVSVFLAESVDRVHFVSVLQRHLDETKALLDVHAVFASPVKRGLLKPARDQTYILSRGHDALEGGPRDAAEVHPVQNLTQHGEPEEVFGHKPPAFGAFKCHVVRAVDGKPVRKHAVRVECKQRAIVGLDEWRRVILFDSLAGRRVQVQEFLPSSVAGLAQLPLGLLALFEHRNVETEVRVVQKHEAHDAPHEWPLVERSRRQAVVALVHRNSTQEDSHGIRQRRSVGIHDGRPDPTNDGEERDGPHDDDGAHSNDPYSGRALLSGHAGVRPQAAFLSPPAAVDMAPTFTNDVQAPEVQSCVAWSCTSVDPLHWRVQLSERVAARHAQHKRDYDVDLRDARRRLHRPRPVDYVQRRPVHFNMHSAALGVNCITSDRQQPVAIVEWRRRHGRLALSAASTGRPYQLRIYARDDVHAVSTRSNGRCPARAPRSGSRTGRRSAGPDNVQQHQLGLQRGGDGPAGAASPTPILSTGAIVEQSSHEQRGSNAVLPDKLRQFPALDGRQVNIIALGSTKAPVVAVVVEVFWARRPPAPVSDWPFSPGANLLALLRGKIQAPSIHDATPSANTQISR